MQKCCVWCFLCCPYILLVLNIFLWKMFSKTKCDAEHFTKENVMLNIFLWKMYALLNIFLWKMYAKMHFGIKCICNILLMQKCIFAKQNVRIKCIFAAIVLLCKNVFGATLTFCKQNVQQNKMLQIHFCKAKQRKAMQNTYTHKIR